MPSPLLLLLGCAPGGSSWEEHAFRPEPPCPAGMLDVGPGSAWLGSAWPTHGPAELPRMEIAVERFCMDALPFPGRAGDRWPDDGLAFRDLPAWERLLAAHGMRLCSPEELFWASASGPAALPFAVGERRGMLCEPSENPEQMLPLGGWPACRSPWGFYDFNVASSWASASAAVDQAREEYRPKPWCVVGGAARDDTFYAPDNFGIHSHGEEDPPYRDDQLRVCADPGAQGDPAAWELFRQAAANQGSFAAALAWHRRFGVEAGVAEVWASGPLPEPEPWW